jgi:mycothiol synthase
VAEADNLTRRLLTERGYVRVRSFMTMRRDLAPDEDPGTSPDGITIRRYAEADEETLHRVHEESFSDHWGFRPTSLESFNEAMHAEDWDPSLVFLADAGDRTVGHAVSFLFEPFGFVAMLGVVHEWRGRGIAKALLRRSFAELASRGKREVQLGVDARNPHGAVALYEGLGMTVHRRDDAFDLDTEEAAALTR